MAKCVVVSGLRFDLHRSSARSDHVHHSPRRPSHGISIVRFVANEQLGLLKDEDGISTDIPKFSLKCRFLVRATVNHALNEF